MSRATPKASLLEVLRRLVPGRVLRVALLYGGTAWVIFQVVDGTHDNLNLPGYTPTLVLILLLAQAPIALVLAWASESRGAARVLPGPDEPMPVPLKAGEIESLAVLPFANMSDNPDAEYLSDGIAEEIINVLVNRSDLRVTARTSSFAFKGKEEDVRSIGAKLGVGAVLEGSVRRSGDRLRITTQLIGVADGYHLWSERFDGEMKDVFAVQDEIAARVVQRLSGRETTTPLAAGRSRPSDMEAYDAYLRGRFHWNHHTLVGYREALACYQEALQREPDYAPVHAGMAACWFWMGFIESQPPDEVYPKAKAAAERALALDPSLAEAHAYKASVGMVYEWDWARAEEGLRRAVELDPGSTTVRQMYSVFLLNTGHVSEAAEQNLEILKLDPLWVKARQDRGSVLAQAGQYETAARELMKALELDPSFPLAHYVLGVAYLGLGRYDAAVDSFGTALRHAGGGTFFQASLGTALAYASRRDEAEGILAEMTAAKATEYVPPVLLAWIHIALGDFDEAFACLEEAWAERSSMLLSAPSFGFFDPVRSDPRFVRLLDRMGLTDFVREPERELLMSPYR